MNAPGFDEFLRELRKFTGFMIPESIRSSVNLALKEAENPDFILPITSSNSPIITAVVNILDNKKTAKQSSPLVSAICALLSNYVIREEAAQPITRKLDQILTLLDQNTCLKIIQYTTSIAEDHLFDTSSMELTFSIVFSLCNSVDQFVATSAVAASDQILKLFTKALLTEQKELPPDKKREIDLCISMTGDINHSITRYREKLAYILFRDLIKLGENKQCLWLRVQNLPTNVTFTLLENISVTNFLNSLAVEAVNIGYANNAPINFFCILFDVSLSKCPKTAELIFTKFLADLVPKNPHARRSLRFYRVAMHKNVTAATNFFKNCDQEGTILAEYISKIKSFVEMFKGTSDYSITLQPKTVEQIESEKEQILANVPVELACYFITSMYKSGKGLIKQLLLKTWEDLISIISHAMKYTNESCVYILMQALHFLIILVTEMDIEQARTSVISSFADCLTSEIESVKQSAFETVTSVMQVCSNAFIGHWNKILQSLIAFDWLPDTGDFSKSLKDDQIIELLLSLFSINSESREWPLAFLVKILISNNDRFSLLWTSVEGYILLLVDDFDSMDDALAVLIELLSEDFEEETEEYLLETFEKLFAGRKNLPVERRSILLEEIRTILAQKGTVIKKGWPHLIGALSPKNFQDEADILNLSFRCVQIICNDLLFLLDLDTKILCTKLFFEFAMQTTDINVALSAFELMWSVVSMAKTTEMWKLIFSHLVSLIGDKRNDVAQTAVKTFFSLIMSNIDSLPDDVVTFIPSDCFMPIVASLNHNSPDFEATQQTAFHELAHCAHSLWDKFSKVEVFPVTFMNKLIHDHEDLFKRITRRETACSALQFYTEILENLESLEEEVRQNLFTSMKNIAAFSISKYDANSAIWGSWGILIKDGMSLQKNILNAEYLGKWIDITKSFFFDLECGAFLPPTAHKTFDGYQLLFPLPTELTMMIYKFFVECAIQTFNAPLSEVALENISIICEKQVSQEELAQLFVISKGLFKLKGARKLLLNFIEKDIEISDKAIDGIYESLIALGESNSELKEKTGRSIAKFFPKLSEDKKNAFLEKYNDYHIPLITLFELFLDMKSETYNEEIALCYTKTINERIGKLLKNIESDDALADALNFLAKAETNPKAFVENSENHGEHLIEILPNISDLLLRTDDKVKCSISNILIRISTRN